MTLFCFTLCSLYITHVKHFLIISPFYLKQSWLMGILSMVRAAPSHSSVWTSPLTT